MMTDPTQLSSVSTDEVATQETNTNNTIQIPNEFICPLTLDIMVDPLVSKFGQSYERMAIIEWITLHGNTTCPMTRRSLHLKDLISNHALAKRIAQWKLDNQYETTASANTTISGRKLKKIKKRSSNSTQEDNDTDSDNDNDDDNNSQHTERILGMYYCTFVEETTDRSNDDPNIILEWRGENNNNDSTIVRPGRNNNRRIVSSSNTSTTATNQRRRQTTRNSGTSTNIQQQQELANNNNITTTTSSSKKFGSFLSRFRSSASSSTKTTATTSTMATPATSTELTA